MGYSQQYTKKAIIAICGMLTFGTGTMVTSKIMLALEACWPETDFITSVTRGDDCTVTHAFEKPWFQAAVMFVGMACCLLIFFFLRMFKIRKYHQLNNNPGTVGRVIADDEVDGLDDTSGETSTDDKNLLEGQQQSNNSTNAQIAKLQAYVNFKWSSKQQWLDYIKVAIPACFDMIATVVMTYGLVYITTSVMQMLRGSMTFFSTLFSICFFRKHIHAYNWIAIVMVIVACAIVGTACIKGSEGTSTHTAAEQAFGCILVVISQFVQAGQIVVESFLLDSVDLPPLIIVGFEGVWGFIITFIAMTIMQFIPGSDDGKVENTVDTFYMLGNNKMIIVATIVYWFCITFLNWSGMTLTRELGPVVRTIWEAVRTAAIWVVDIFIYYVVVKHSVFGESWNEWSFLQLLGFCILVWGSFTNNAMVKYPKLYYPPPYLIGKRPPDPEKVKAFLEEKGTNDNDKDLSY